MDVAAFATHIRALPFGKKLPRAVYVHAPEPSGLPFELGEISRRLRSDLTLGPEFNVLKFAYDGGISFLEYPSFEELPHPELLKSVKVSLVTGKVSRSRYGMDGNPPILHRKELLVPPGYPNAEAWARLTAQEERAGLYDETSIIGFKATWERLLREKGLTYDGLDLVRDISCKPVDTAEVPTKERVHRHRTALSRPGLSKPIRLGLDQGVIRQETTIFDYGCGRGSDAAFLKKLGYCVESWDPVFFPNHPKIPADVVNLGFVLNVIENPSERLEVLRDAWALSRQALIVSTLIQGQEGHCHSQPHGDGVITSRRTFQKYFEQGELQGMLEAVLEEEPHALSLGVFVVFKDPSFSQSFFERRRRRTIDWESFRRRFASFRRPKQSRVAALYERHGELLDAYWAAALELGRRPQSGEFHRETELREAAGSPATVFRLLTRHHGSEAFEEAAARRKEDLLVYLALTGFRKRIPFKYLSSQLRTDIATFFGGYSKAQDAGRELLMSLGDEAALWETAAALPFGWRDTDAAHFVIHASLFDKLPPSLRVFIECGAILAGDPREADLIKLHLRSRKVSFLFYEDFFPKPFPELKTRVKADLARLQVRVFEYGFALPEQLLFYKERFVAEDEPRRERMLQISRRLAKLGVLQSELGANDENAPPQQNLWVLSGSGSLPSV